MGGREDEEVEEGGGGGKVSSEHNGTSWACVMQIGSDRSDRSDCECDGDKKKEWKRDEEERREKERSERPRAKLPCLPPHSRSRTNPAEVKFHGSKIDTSACNTIQVVPERASEPEATKESERRPKEPSKGTVNSLSFNRPPPINRLPPPSPSSSSLDTPPSQWPSSPAAPARHPAHPAAQRTPWPSSVSVASRSTTCASRRTSPAPGFASARPACRE